MLIREMNREQLVQKLEKVMKNLSTPSTSSLELYDLKAILENQIEALDKQAAHLWEASEVGKKYESCTFENFNPEGFETQYKAAKKFTKDFEYESGKGLLMYGTYGTGKTHLAVAIARELLKEKGCSVWFKTFGELLQDLRNSFKDGVTKEISHKYFATDVLVMDDLGKEKLSDWANEQLFNIVNERYKNKKTIIITTNLSIEALNRRLDGAVMSRLVETCKAIEMSGRDYRINE